MLGTHHISHGGHLASYRMGTGQAEKPNGQLEVCAFDPSDPPGRGEGMDTDSINRAYTVKPNKNSLKLR